jgi:hypothetical protein
MDHRSETSKAAPPWLSVSGTASAALEQRISERLAAVAGSDSQRARDLARVRALAVWGERAGGVTSAHRLDLLRRLCQLYAVEIEARPLSSHRRLIGPVIVAAKRVLFSVLTPLLGPSFKHQAEFNAVTVMLLHELCQGSEPGACAESAKRCSYE